MHSKLILKYKNPQSISLTIESEFDPITNQVKSPIIDAHGLGKLMLAQIVFDNGETLDVCKVCQTHVMQRNVCANNQCEGEKVIKQHVNKYQKHHKKGFKR